MGFSLFGKKFNDADASNVENFSSITADQASKLLKELSGGKIKKTNRLVDNVVVFSSASGGAGASTIAANVAYTAFKRGLRVMVVDLNILTPAQQLYVETKQAIEKPDLVSYLLGKTSFGESIEHVKTGSLLYANNRSLMDYISCESDSAIENFKDAIYSARGLFDLIIIDTPMRVDNNLCNQAFYLADQVYMVWDEGISSISNTEKIRRAMAYTGIDIYTKMKVILNKRTNTRYSEYPFNKLNIELIQFLPFEPDVAACSLSSEIFCQKVASNSDNAGYFCGGIESLTSKIFEIGGLVE